MIIRPTLPETPNYTTPRGTICGQPLGRAPGHFTAMAEG